MISDEGRLVRFERWGKLGLEAVKDDLRTGGYRLIGGPLELRELASEWVRLKEAELERAEVFILKPTFYGVGVDLKEARRAWKRWRQK